MGQAQSVCSLARLMGLRVVPRAGTGLREAADALCADPAPRTAGSPPLRPPGIGMRLLRVSDQPYFFSPAFSLRHP